MVRAEGGLHPVFSPTGQWDKESEDELLGDWMASRLANGQLKALLEEAATSSAFARLAEAALRRHAISRRERSQAANLFDRLRAMLPEDEQLALMHDAARDQDTAWGLRSWDEVRPVWTGDDKALASAAWSLGHFDTITFKADAKKLSHLLEVDELRRFVHGLLEAVRASLTLTQIVRALELRFDLGPVALVELDERTEVAPPGELPVEDEATARRAAIAVLAELTPRQGGVLRLQLGRTPMRDIAAELGVSLGTVSSEWGKVTTVMRRISDAEDAHHAALLNVLRDVLF